MTNFFSYLMMLGSLLMALWSLRQIWYGYSQHFLLFICSVIKIVLEADYIVHSFNSVIRNIAWNFIDMGYMLILYSYAKYGILSKASMMHKSKVFMPFLRRPDLTAKLPPTTVDELRQAIRKAKLKLQTNAKPLDGR